MGGKWKKHKAAAAAVAGAGVTLPSKATAAASNGVSASPMSLDTHNHTPPAKAVPASTFPAQSAQRRSTLSIAVPGSVIEAAASAEAAAAAAAQIARAAATFRVDEVIVYEDAPSSTGAATPTISLATATLGRLLQYLETPAHLRAGLFPGAAAYPELRAAEGLCPTLHTPHHARGGGEWSAFREGIVMRSEPGMGSFVDIGSDRNAHVAAQLPVGRRITVSLGGAPQLDFVPAFSETMLKAQVASPGEAAACTGQYWGYTVRMLPSLSRALKEGPGRGGYDLIIGTSREGVTREAAELVLPQYTHALVVFGGLQGLEDIAAADEAIAQSGKAVTDLLSMYLNCCPDQGTDTIHTEDAVTLCLAYLHASLLKYAEPGRVAKASGGTR